MTPTRVITTISSLILLSSLVACGRGEIRMTCDEPQPYQAVVPGKRVVVPDGLDPLDEFKEMPVPKADTPPRPEGSKCIEYPPPLTQTANGGRYKIWRGG
jgi:hypothetical protein